MSREKSVDAELQKMFRDAFELGVGFERGNAGVSGDEAREVIEGLYRAVGFFAGMRSAGLTDPDPYVAEVEARADWGAVMMKATETLGLPLEARGPLYRLGLALHDSSVGLAGLIEGQEATGPNQPAASEPGSA